MKYYYNDPIKAAYMAKEFEVKFEPWIFNKEMHMPDGTTYKYKESRKITYELLLKDTDQKKSPYYIHPNCHEMLKPQAGDVIVSEGGTVGKIANIDDSYPPSYIFLDHLDREITRVQIAFENKIIYRNGKSFFAPESEAI